MITIKRIRFFHPKEIDSHSLKIGKWYQVHSQPFNNTYYIFNEEGNDIYFTTECSKWFMYTYGKILRYPNYKLRWLI